MIIKTKLDKEYGISLIKKHFSESWIEELSDDYKEILKEFDTINKVIDKINIT